MQADGVLFAFWVEGGSSLVADEAVTSLWHVCATACISFFFATVCAGFCNRVAVGYACHLSVPSMKSRMHSATRLFPASLGCTCVQSPAGA